MINPLNKRTSETLKRSNWRCDFNDGSKFTGTVEGDNAKSKLVLSHTDIPNNTSAYEWKLLWKKIITDLEI